MGGDFAGVVLVKIWRTFARISFFGGASIGVCQDVIFGRGNVGSFW